MGLYTLNDYHSYFRNNKNIESYNLSFDDTSGELTIVVKFKEEVSENYEQELIEYLEYNTVIELYINLIIE